MLDQVISKPVEDAHEFYAARILHEVRQLLQIRISMYWHIFNRIMPYQKHSTTLSGRYRLSRVYVRAIHCSTKRRFWEYTLKWWRAKSSPVKKGGCKWSQLLVHLGYATAELNAAENVGSRQIAVYHLLIHQISRLIRMLSLMADKQSKLGICRAQSITSNMPKHQNTANDLAILDSYLNCVLSLQISSGHQEMPSLSLFPHTHHLVVRMLFFGQTTLELSETISWIKKPLLRLVRGQ